MLSLEDRVVVITGASRGIGEAIAMSAAAHGAKLVIASRKQEALDVVANRLRHKGAQVLTKATHMGDAAAIDDLFAAAVDRFGKVDGLVNNAATNPYFGPMLSIDDGAFDKTFEVNVKGYFRACVAFVKAVRAAKLESASIVNIASIAGMRSAPLQGVYGMTKAAVISMTQSLAYELGASGIRVNAVCPGLIDTRFAAAIVKNPMLLDKVVERTPLGRHGKPEEIAGACTYLLSDAASFTTGQCMVIDGGMTAS